MQEAFLAVFTRLDHYRERDGIPFAHWIARLTINLCRERLRSERRRRPTPSLSPETLAVDRLSGRDPAPPADEVLGARAAVEASCPQLHPETGSF